MVQSMNIMEAFTKGEAARNQDAEMKYLDYGALLEDVKTRKPLYLSVGLAEDWGCTGGSIIYGGKITNDYIYTDSIWATPTAVFGENQDGDEKEFSTPNKDGMSVEQFKKELEKLGYTRD